MDAHCVQDTDQYHDAYRVNGHGY